LFEALVERAEDLLDEALERLGPRLVLALRDLEDLRFRVVEVVADLEVVLVALFADLTRGEDQLARLRVVFDDLGVRDDVVGRRNAERELAEVRDAADRLELALLGDFVF
jgi:hypothetical protein